MGSSFIPQGYQPHLSLYQTQRAISLIKRVFQDSLAHALHLERVSAPLFVEPGSGLNDNLNGVERPVSFDIPFAGADAEVVHSLAKWKRMALYRYEIEPGMGIYTDMNAIRRDEALDNLHSIYVDQWDWEKVITEESRTIFTLHQAVCSIVESICDTQLTVRGKYPQLCETPLLSREVTFVTAQELEDRYPDLTPKQRENEFVREHGTVFIQGIGGKLRSGMPHDGRAPDYD
ncbi:MAG: aspartate--ammonia ligase, partial [Clostridiales bacterium]|nr:aspartate--ammonia ligase [Clostridiales bacterium]